MIFRSRLDDAFSTLDKAIELINMILKFSKLFLGGMPRGNDFHQSFQIMI